MKNLKFLRDLIPFNIGSFLGEWLEDNSTPPKVLNREQAIKHLLKFVIYSVIVYYFEDAKEWIMR